jgi:hypothetical protein
MMTLCVLMAKHATNRASNCKTARKATAEAQRWYSGTVLSSLPCPTRAEIVIISSHINLTTTPNDMLVVARSGLQRMVRVPIVALGKT